MKAVYRFFYHISILLSFVLAGITLTGAFSGYIPAEKYGLIAFIGLVLPVLLIINLIVAIYWTIRWRYWVFVPLIAILGNWGYMSRVFQFPFTSPETTETDPKSILTVATYNVDSFNRESSGSSCKGIAQYMKEHKVDVLCFQEFGTNKYFNADSVKNTLKKWPYSYIPQAPDSISILQIAVFSKYPISEKKELITYRDSRNCSSWCDITVNGKIIRLFNNHLQTTEVTQNRSKLIKQLDSDNSEGSERAIISMAKGLHENFIKRAEQATFMNKLVNDSPYPIILCGDFNSLPSSNTYRIMKGDKLKDGFQTCGHGYMYTFHYFKRLLRIDYIFHSPDINGLDYYSPDLIFSDHNPVVMKMRL